jgi:lauroyl/myristoyl acyltransferase
MNFVDGFYVDDKNEALKRQVKVIEEYISKDISKWYLFHRRFRPVEKYKFK